MADIGNDIKRKGWRQGSILKPDDLRCFSPNESTDHGSVGIGIVISHSCDVTHHSLIDEPYVEIIIGHETVLANHPGRRGNYTYAKNPRLLCLAIGTHPDGESWIELSIHSIQRLPRKKLLEIEPDYERFLDNPSLRILTTWLADRYRRAAFPDRFNEILDSKRSKLKICHKKMSPWVSGIYVLLFPDRETVEGECYGINLLATVPEMEDVHLEEARASINELARIMQSAGVDVAPPQVRLENEVSLATIRDMKKLSLEAISLGGGDQHPTAATDGPTEPA